MQAGRLRHRIIIQEHQITRDTYQGEIEAWGEVATVWAEVSPISGREFILQQRAEAEVTHRVRLRYRAGLKPQMRVLFSGRVLQIEAVLNQEERHRELVLMCRERVQ